MEPEIERRTYPIGQITVRAAGAEPPLISGHAAVFNELSEDLGGFYERIQPGAFATTLQSADVRALWNHDTNYPLGRSQAGTLRLAEDEIGLAFEIDPPDTSYARDLLVSMRRGDINQMSFAFQIVRDKWEQVGGQVIRTLLEVKLFDVSPVTFPAYPQASAQARSRAEALAASGQAPMSGDQPDAVAAKVRHAHRRRHLEILKLK